MADRDRRSGGILDDPVEVLVVVGGVVVMVLVFGVWLWGQAAGLLFAFAWPDVGLGAMPSVVGGLGAHLDDPRLAWPVAAQAELPGPFGFYLTAALGLPVTVALGFIAVRLARRVRGRRSPDHATAAPRSSRREIAYPRRRAERLDGESTAWATEHDLREDGLLVASTPAGRLGIGWAYESQLATRPEHSLLVVGASRSGKTTGLAIPALLEWQGPAVVLSAKTDLIHETYGARREHGDVLVFDPTGVSGLPSAGWSPLSRSVTWRGAVRTANALSRLSGTTSGLGGSAHWERVAAQVLAPLLRAAAADAAFDMGDVVRWVQEQRIDEPKAVLGALAEEDPDVAVGARSIEQYLHMDPRMRDSAFGTASTVLDGYQDPEVVASSRSWDVQAERLLSNSPTTPFLVANASDQSRLAPVFLALLDEVLTAAQRRASICRSRAGHPVEDDSQRLLLLLDEAANIAPLPNLATLASTGGSEGIQLVTVLQDLSQLRHRYPHEWGSIFSNHVAKVVLPGVTDPDTLRTFSQTIGREEVVSRSTSQGRAQRHVTESVRSREIASERELRELRSNTGVCVYGNLPPLRFGLRQCFTDPALALLTRRVSERTVDVMSCATAPSPSALQASSWLVVPVPDMRAKVDAGEAERVGSSDSSPVRWRGRFYNPGTSGEFLPVTEPSQIEALERGLERWRKARSARVRSAE